MSQADEQWIEVSVTVDGESAEVVAEALRRYVHQGVAVEQYFPDEAWDDQPLPPGPLMVKAYFPDDEQAAETQRKIEEALYYLGRLRTIPEPAFRTVAQEDWADAWKRNYHPVRVGKHLLIKPAWAEAEIEPADIVIEMDPGMAFGTGTHPSTHLCLQACEWFVRPATTMVDIGTGSGILAIAAAKLGSYRILALDTDPLAVKTAQENAALNGVADRITVQRGSVKSLQGTARHFDFAVANLTARIILKLAPQGLRHAVWPGSKFVFSGIIEEQADEVAAALDAVGLEELGRRQLEDWVLLITQRKIAE